MKNSTGMFTILGSTGLGKNLKIDETHRHKAQSKPRHRTREQYQQHYY